MASRLSDRLAKQDDVTDVMIASDQEHDGMSSCRSEKTRLALSVFLALALVGSAGCNYVVLLGYLIGGPPSIQPDFDAETGESLTEKGVVAAVVCFAPLEIKDAFHDVDRELAKYVAYRLRQHHIDVIDPDRVAAWLDENPDWDTPEEVGAALQATHVIYIDLQNYSLFEKNSATLYRGRAEGLVSVVRMDADGEGERIFSKEIISQYPLRVPRSTRDVSYTTFKRQYLSRLSEEIGRLFYEHYAGDDIPDAT